MAKNLTMTKGLVVSEAVMMGLAPKLGRQTAHDIVYDACRAAVSNDEMLAEVLKRDPKVAQALSDAEIDHLCSPGNYLGLSGTMVDRVLLNYKQSLG